MDLKKNPMLCVLIFSSKYQIFVKRLKKKKYTHSELKVIMSGSNVSIMTYLV